MQEKPKGPAEAFSSISVNNYPVIELKAQLRMAKARDLNNVKGTPVEMYYKGGELICKPILDGSASPIMSYTNLPPDKRGCIIMYEQPNEVPPKGLFKIGYDPVRQDRGSSLAAIIVYKGVQRGSHRKNIIAAEYISGVCFLTYSKLYPLSCTAIIHISSVWFLTCSNTCPHCLTATRHIFSV